MSVGFGFSFGDFVSAISLVITLYDALQDSRGASDEIRMLQDELKVLETALKTVDGCKLSESQYSTAIQAVGGCHKCIAEFTKRVLDKYVPITLRHMPLKDSLKKVKWVLCKKEEVNSLRAKLAGQVQALNLLISAIQLSHATEAEKITSEQLKEQNRIINAVQQQLERSDTNYTQLLQKIDALAANPAENQIINAVHQRLERSDTDYTQLLHKIESLAARPTGPEAEPTPPNYEIRPMRLTGAPRIPQDQFIKRSNLLSLLEKALLPYSDETQKSVVLQGFGGVGKSQLALQYALIHQRTYTAVFWLNAKTETTLKLGIAQLAEQIPLANVLDATRQIPKDRPGIEAARAAVTNWLSHEGNIGWLLVIDNLDSQISDTGALDETEDAVSTSNKAFDASKYVPQVPHGSMLITSRLSFAGNAFGASTVEVNEMSEGEGIELLCNISKRATGEEGIKSLVKRLGAHPLALSQAGRFIAETHTTPLDYIQKFDIRFKTLLKDRPKLNQYHNGSIAATLGLSYDQLKLRDRSAAALLMLFSCLDNSSISYQLFEALPKAKAALVFASDDMPFDPNCHWIPGLPHDWLTKLCHDESIYLKCITSLHELSFVRHNDRSNGVSIHPLIYEWLSHYCDQDEMSITENLCAVCNLLGAAVPQDKPHVKGLPYSKIEPHVTRWYSLLPPDLKLSKASVGALLAISEYYMVQGPQERVSPLRHFAYDSACKRFGDGHRCTAEAGMAIAMVHFEAEEYEMAMHLFEHHRQSYIKISWFEEDFGCGETEDIEDLLVTTYLMFCYRATGKLEKANQASEKLATIKAKLKGTALYPLAAWFFFITQDNTVGDGEEEGVARARMQRSLQTSEDLLHDIQHASTWLPLYGSRENAEANVLSVLGQQHLEYGDKAKGQAYLQRALKLKGQLWGNASTLALTQARELIESGAVSETPLLLRDNAWRSTVLKALKTLSEQHYVKSNIVKGSIRKRLQSAKKTENAKKPETEKKPDSDKNPEGKEESKRDEGPNYSIWHHKRWLEALLTIREARLAASAD